MIVYLNDSWFGFLFEVDGYILYEIKKIITRSMPPQKKKTPNNKATLKSAGTPDPIINISVVFQLFLLSL